MDNPGIPHDLPPVYKPNGSSSSKISLSSLMKLRDACSWWLHNSRVYIFPSPTRIFLILNELFAPTQIINLQTKIGRLLWGQMHLQTPTGLSPAWGEGRVEGRIEEHPAAQRQRPRRCLSEQGPAWRAESAAPNRSRHLSTVDCTQDCPY